MKTSVQSPILECAHCSRRFRTSLIPPLNGWSKYCTQSCADAALESTFIAQSRRLDSILKATMPRWYVKHGLGHPSFNGSFWDSIYLWEPADSVPFLGLCGEVGICKYGSAYHMLWNLITEGLEASLTSESRIPTFAVISAADFFPARDCDRPLSDGDALQDRLELMDFLLVLDLEKIEKMTVTDELSRLFEKRKEIGLPTIWTAACKFSELKDMLAGRPEERILEFLQDASRIANC